MTISHTIVINTSSNSIIKSNKTSSHNDPIALVLVNNSTINIISIIMTINISHANITGDIINDILNILDITDSLYTNDTLDTIDIYYTRGKLIPIAITILVILI